MNTTHSGKGNHPPECRMETRQNPEPAPCSRPPPPVRQPADVHAHHGRAETGAEETEVEETVRRQPVQSRASAAQQAAQQVVSVVRVRSSHKLVIASAS